MPCRALEAFGQTAITNTVEDNKISCLNALSGIGGVRAQKSELGALLAEANGLNALSGIGGVRAYYLLGRNPALLLVHVLMPCRALEAFGLSELLRLLESDQ